MESDEVHLRVSSTFLGKQSMNHICNQETKSFGASGSCTCPRRSKMGRRCVALMALTPKSNPSNYIRLSFCSGMEPKTFLDYINPILSLMVMHKSIWIRALTSNTNNVSYIICQRVAWHIFFSPSQGRHVSLQVWHLHVERWQQESIQPCRDIDELNHVWWH